MQNSHLALASLLQVGRDAVRTRMKRDPFSTSEKGGDYAYSLFMRLIHTVNILLAKLKKEMNIRYFKKSIDSQKVDLLIRAAAWIRLRGQIRPISDIPAPEEEIGILFNVMRRRKKLSLEKLANQTGIPMEELIAFEAGLLQRPRTFQMLPVLAQTVGITYEDLLQHIQQNTGKFFDR